MELDLFDARAAHHNFAVSSGLGLATKLAPETYFPYEFSGASLPEEVFVFPVPSPSSSPSSSRSVCQAVVKPP
jgi:hypothetical protein